MLRRVLLLISVLALSIGEVKSQSVTRNVVFRAIMDTLVSVYQLPPLPWNPARDTMQAYIFTGVAVGGIEGPVMVPDSGSNPPLYTVTRTITATVGDSVQWKFHAKPDTLFNGGQSYGGYETGSNNIIRWTNSAIDTVITARPRITVNRRSSLASTISGDVRSYRLGQNYPNPFNPTTKILFNLPVAGAVSLSVYDVLGREIKNLLRGEKKSAGQHVIGFEASNLPSGIYFYRLTVGSFVQTKKMSLLK